tara:strand:+ start:484 stop:816 length:333 start_codon:yes stop_codon:yes gene_type:complete
LINKMIGHNNPPKDRDIEWKSISINKWVYKELQEIAERICNQKNCFLLLDGRDPIKKVSIPYVIELLAHEKTMLDQHFETQDNGRNIWEQTAKRLLRSYKSKRGLKLNAK